MSVSSAAANRVIDGCIVYENAVKHGHHYDVVTKENGYMDVLWEGKVIDSDLPYCEDPIPSVDADAWERYESVQWFAERGIANHKPRVPFA